MLNKIKDKILHVLRNYCGYYEMEDIKGHYQNMCYNYSEDFKIYNKKTAELNDKNFELQTEIISTQVELDKLSVQHESKILEYDILFAKNEANVLERDILDNKYKTLVNIYTNCRTVNNHYDIDEIIKVGNSENTHLYKKYLVAELEEILNIMKQKEV